LKSDYYFTDNPGLSESATKYLISKEINLVGIDSPSIDLGKDKTFSVHKILAKNNILIVENLSNLNKISSKQFDFVILPLKLKDATGSPVRAIAIQRTK
jgi:kynurenine formamidase